MKNFVLPLSLLIFCLALFSFKADDVAAGFKGDENFYFQSAKEMLQRGDFITPRYLGSERFQKPILFYWFIIGFFKVAGISWFSARLPSILFGALTTVLIYYISNLMFDDVKIGMCAALFTATSCLWYRYARLAVPDMALIFFITLALFCYLRRCYNSSGRLNMTFFFIFMALAFLVKGISAVALPLFIITAYHLAVRKKLPFSVSEFCVGIGIFLVITVPWFYLMYRQYGNSYLHYVWNREVLQRLGYGHTTNFFIRYGKSVGFYVTSLIAHFPPYSFFIPFALIRSVGIIRGRGSEDVREYRSRHMFLVTWIAVVFVFFTFVAERHEHYLLALVPAAFILIGEYFVRALRDEQFFFKSAFRIPYYLSIAAVIFFTLLCVVSFSVISGNAEVSQWWFLLIPIAILAGYRYKKTVLMPLSFVLSLTVLHILLVVSPPFGGLFTNKMQYAARIIAESFHDGDRIGIGSHGIIPEELQVYFEDTPVEVVKVRYYNDGTPHYETAKRLLDFLSAEERVFCVIKKRDYETFVPGEIKDKLYILDSYYVWKRRIRFNTGSFHLRNYSPGNFREIFQNELYIVSNKEAKEM